MKTAQRKAAKHKRQWQANPDAMPYLIRRTQPLTHDEILAEMLPIHEDMHAVDAGTHTDMDEARLLALGCAVRARGIAIDPDAGAITGEDAIAACEAAYGLKTLERKAA